MTTRHTHGVLIARDEIVAAPAARACDDHSFELPTALYGAMALMFAGFVSVLAFALRDPQLAVPFGVIIAFLIAFFTVPSLWPRIKPAGSRTTALSWDAFMDKGIDTATGRTSGAGAAVLVLLLPFLVFCFAIAVATIVALV